jgi:hypothetical protein
VLGGPDRGTGGGRRRRGGRLASAGLSGVQLTEYLDQPSVNLLEHRGVLGERAAGDLAGSRDSLIRPMVTGSRRRERAGPGRPCRDLAASASLAGGLAVRGCAVSRLVFHRPPSLPGRLPAAAGDSRARAGPGWRGWPAPWNATARYRHHAAPSAGGRPGSRLPARRARLPVRRPGGGRAHAPGRIRVHATRENSGEREIGMATAEQCRAALDGLTARIAELDPSARAAHLRERTLSCQVTDLGMTFVTRLRSDGADPVTVAANGAPPAQIRFAAASDDLVAIANDPGSFVRAWLSGRLRVEGSLLDLLSLRKLL